MPNKNNKTTNVPLKVIVVGGWGSNWKIKSETIPGSTRYPISNNKTSSSRLNNKVKKQHKAS